MKLKVYASLHDDISEGFVWLPSAQLGDQSSGRRSVVRVRNQATGASVYCEALQLDENFIHRYNDPEGWRGTIRADERDTSIVMNAWYRRKLGGLETRKEYELLVDHPEDDSFAKLYSCLDHPQTVVRVACMLGLISTGASLVGVGVSLIPHQSVLGWVVVFCGLMTPISPLCRRP